MIAKIRLDSYPPIGCNPADRALTGRVDPKHQLRVGRQWTIAAELQIKQIVQEAIATEAGDLLRVNLVDEGTGSRHRRQSRADIRKAPRRDRVPDILDGRVVVGGYAPEQSVAVDVYRLREAYVSIVPTETAGDP